MAQGMFGLCLIVYKQIKHKSITHSVHIVFADLIKPPSGYIKAGQDLYSEYYCKHISHSLLRPGHHRMCHQSDICEGDCCMSTLKLGSLFSLINALK